MELAEGGSLASAIAKGGLGRDDWLTKRRLSDEIAQGLAFIHQENVLHCNLKSTNVLLTKRMEATLAGFGLAKLHSVTTTAATTNEVGLERTWRWMAPELMLDADPKYSTKSDMYSLGMVMWEMAAHCTRPFKDLGDDKEVAELVVMGVREVFPEDTPDDYSEWVKRCWHEDPTQRPEASETVLAMDDVAELGGDSGDGNDKDPTSRLLESISGRRTPYRLVGEFEEEDGQNKHIDQLTLVDAEVIARLHKAAGHSRLKEQYDLKPLNKEGRQAYTSVAAAVERFTKAAKQGYANAPAMISQ
ncbi:hypothetical protein BGZ73_000893, partial [Actinomortierella ambigua]